MKIENDLGRDDIRRLVLRLAIPSMLAQFINVLYSVVDRIYIGNIPVIGETALAGVGVSGPIVTLILSLIHILCNRFVRKKMKNQNCAYFRNNFLL